MIYPDLNKIEEYYSKKIEVYGATSHGVDWNSEESQKMRFSQLISVINKEKNFSLLDFGCGYGALLPFLKSKFSDFEYWGFDISDKMLLKAGELFPNDAKVKWLDKIENKSFDYSIASGVFNVRLKNQIEVWQTYVIQTLDQLNSISTEGFAFNMLTKYSDPPYMKEYLYYADPCFYFDYCKRHFSRNVALLHDYGLYEFSIIVKKY